MIANIFDLDEEKEDEDKDAGSDLEEIYNKDWIETPVKPRGPQRWGSPLRPDGHEVKLQDVPAFPVAAVLRNEKETASASEEALAPNWLRG
eukprot:11460178-Karenia_brevis.AAC.1